MSRRPTAFSLLITGALLFLLLAPAMALHLRAIGQVIEHPALWEKVSPFTPTSLSLLWRSLLLCMGVFGASLLMGVPVGFGLARGPRWWRIAAGPLCAIALSIPPALSAAPFVSLSVSAGVPEDGSLGTFLLAVLALAGCYFPLVAGATMIAVQSLPPGEEEAALLLSGEWGAWTGVLRGRILPAALGGAFGSAALALWEMGAPDLLGWPTFSMHVYRNLAATDASVAGLFQLSGPLTSATTGLPVLVLGLALLWPAMRLLRGLELRAVTGLSAEAPSRLGNGLCVLGSLTLLMFPLWLLARFAWAIESEEAAKIAVAANVDIIENTILLPGIAALVGIAGSFVLGVMWRQWPLRWRQGVLLLVLCPMLVTPVVLGVALIEAWNHAAFAAIYDSPYGMTLIGYGARFGPLLLALMIWSVQSVEEDLLRAAQGLGANWPTLGRTIIAPLLKTTLVGLCALMFALCAGELTVTVLVQSPGGATLPIPIFSLLHAGLAADVAILSLLQCALSGGAMVLASLFLYRRTAK
jgi:ABC-type Fe3+ transport system permease subunit